MSLLFDSLLLLFISAYLFISPFTKVEESFNTQAVHDIIYYGVVNLDKYDHFQFPGVVPRTFIGALFMAGLTAPIVHYLPASFSKLDGQLISRGMLGVVNALFIVYLKNCAFGAIKHVSHSQRVGTRIRKKILKGAKAGARKSGAGAADAPDADADASADDDYKPLWSFGLWFMLFQIAQFHIPYYSSRYLPNYLALPLTNYAFAQFFKGNSARTLSVLAFTAVVFRVELLALVVALSVVLVYHNKISQRDLVIAVAKGASLGCVLSGAVDSYFWQRPTIPELESFYFNVVEGKASEWGVEPVHSYFTRHLPGIFLPPHVLILAVVGYFVDPTNNLFKMATLACICYISLLSLQPHKERRFVVYTVPIFTLAGANGAAYITSRMTKSFLYKLLVLGTLFLTLVSMAISVFWGEVSAFNYPGGYALIRFHEHIIMKAMRGEPVNKDIVVHIDPAACMTGVTHFCELTGNGLGFELTYDRNETPTLQDWEHYDYIITDVGPKDNTNHKIPYMEGWNWSRIASSTGFAGLDLSAIHRIDPIATLRYSWAQRSVRPIVATIRKFIHEKEMFHIYQKVAGETKVEPLKPKRTRKKLSDQTSVSTV